MRRLHVSTQVDKLHPVLVDIAKHYGLKTIGGLQDFILNLPYPTTKVYYNCFAKYVRASKARRLLEDFLKGYSYLF